MRNKKTLISIISVVAIVLVLIGVTYAYWLVTKEQQGENVISSACLDISMIGTNDINLPSQYPISDEDGMETTPYTFTVTNNCTTSIDYQINLETLGSEDNSIIPSAIKVAINKNESTEVTPRLLNSKPTVATTIANAYAANKLTEGVLKGKSDATYELRLWLDKDAPISEQNKTFTSKISVTVGQGIYANPYKEGTLAYNIVESNGGAVSLIALSSSELRLTNNSGLYKAEDDLGTSYYFRGAVTNNYVRLNHNPIILSLAYEGVDPFGEVIDYYATLEECQENAFECNELEEPQSKEVAQYSYWRIIRTNGDGTIRMMYDSINSVIFEGEFGDFYGFGDFGIHTSSFYGKYLRDKYSSYIADSSFCVDEEFETTNALLEGAYVDTYAVVDRLADAMPTLKCKTDYVHTVANNKSVYPVGLITADEVFLAGGNNTITNSYLKAAKGYLTSNKSYVMYETEDQRMDSNGYAVTANGLLLEVGPNSGNSYVVYPVINLKEDVRFEGVGTKTNPYKIVME